MHKTFLQLENYCLQSGLFRSYKCFAPYFVSGASMILAELAVEAGLPNGVLNIVHGTNVCSVRSIIFYCYFLP